MIGLWFFENALLPLIAKSAAPDTQALFAEINRGDAVTKGLRKVTDDMKTHKNPELRATGPMVTTKKPTGPPAIPARPDQRKAVQPKLEFVGNKWLVVRFKPHRPINRTSTTSSLKRLRWCT